MFSEPGYHGISNIRLHYSVLLIGDSLDSEMDVQWQEGGCGYLAYVSGEPLDLSIQQSLLFLF